MGIVGSNVRPGVKEQLNQREQLYAGSNRDITTIQGQNNTSWIRLASSVDIDGSSAKAKQFVLFGGTGEMNAGIALGGNSYFVEAYPFSKSQGYRPNPGIESLSFQYKNNGALATCDIDIKCFTFEQFDAIEKLYLRPGYSILVEWGHTKYVNNAGKVISLKKGDVDGAFTTFMNGGSSQVGQLTTQIKNQRNKQDFNYDGFFGKIVNFQWTFNADLSYSITIKTITHGDIIEKLKINTATPESIAKAKEEQAARKEEIEKEANDEGGVLDSVANGLGFVGEQIAKFFTGLFETGNEFLGDIVDSIDDETWARKLIAKRTKSQIHRILFKLLQNFEPVANAKGGIGEGVVEKLKNTTDISTSSNAAAGTATGQVTILQSEAIRVGFDVSSADDQDLGNYQYYMTFGALLKIIEKTIYQDEAGLPLVRIDCQYGQTGMLTFPGQISADPLTCLIPHTVYPTIVEEGLSFSGGGISYKILQDPALTQDFYLDETNAVGDLMKVMLNFNYIMQAYEDTMDEDGNIALIDFVKKVLDDITLALGGINKFATRVEDEGIAENIIEARPTLVIYDEGAHIKKKEKEGSPVVLKPYGVTKTKGTTFLDVSFSSELSNEFASQISIGAQANGNQPGENATAFSEFNKGLIDRMVKVKTAPDTTEDTVVTKIAGTLLDLQEATNELYAEAEIDKDVIKTAVSVNSTYAKYCIGQLVTSQTIPAPFFIPFNLKIKMKGISGIRIFDKIYLEDNILPQSYRGNVSFILKAVNHEVSENQWTTSLETLTVPDGEAATVIEAAVGDLKDAADVYKLKQEKLQQSREELIQAQKAQDAKNAQLAGGGSGGVGTVGPGTTLRRGLPYTAQYLVGTMPKTQITVHYTASSPKSTLAGVVNGFNTRTDKVATHYVLDLDGEYDLLFPLREAWAWHLGVNIPVKEGGYARRDTDSAGLTGADYALFDRNLNHKAVGIEVCNAGMLKVQGGKYVDTLNSGYIYPESEVSKSVGPDGKERKWHGYLYWHKFPAAQIKELEKLILEIISNEPEISPKGKPWKFKYEDCFPSTPNGGAKTSRNALIGTPGIYTHNSYSTRKSDVPPVPEIIAMFKRIEKKLAGIEEAKQENCPNAYKGVLQLSKELDIVANNFGYNTNTKTWVNKDKQKDYEKEVIKVRNTMAGFLASITKVNKGTDKANKDKGPKLENVIRNTWKGNAKAWAAWEFAGDGRGTGVKYSSDYSDNSYEDAVEAKLDEILKPFNKDSNL